MLAHIRDHLAAAGIDAQFTREPGGTEAGEAIRRVLLDPAYRGLCAESELLLMFAARAQLVREVIRPALAAGRWVVSDRFTDASFAYQGGGRGQPEARISDLEAWAADGLRPDLTLLLDLPVAQGMARAGSRGGEADRIEREQLDFFERVRAAYRARAATDPARFRLIDASRPIADVLAQIEQVLAHFIAARSAP